MAISRLQVARHLRVLEQVQPTVVVSCELDVVFVGLQDSQSAIVLRSDLKRASSPWTTEKGYERHHRCRVFGTVAVVFTILPEELESR